MLAASIILWAVGAGCIIVCVAGTARVIAEANGWARDTGDHEQAIVGAIILGLVSAGIFALASLAWSAA
jgi:hypothetical protein